MVADSAAHIENGVTIAMVDQIQPNAAQHALHQSHVSREQFLQLMVSRQPLQRLDDRKNRLRGLLDQSGRWFVVQESELNGHA